MRIVVISRKPGNSKACISSILSRDPSVKLTDFLIVANGDRESWERWMLDRPEIIFRDVPFIFAQAANVGINHAGGDVLLLNDDTELLTPNGISNLVAAAPPEALTSAHCVGAWTYREAKFVSFVAVLIPRFVLDKVGPFDERFTKYGYEDDDYCRRCVASGVAIRVTPDCVFVHHHPHRSTFHGPNNFYDGDNLVAFNEKYGINYRYTWPEHLAEVKRRSGD